MGERNNFDLLRLAAASQVMFCHAARWFGLDGQIPMPVWRAIYAFPGVPVFFVISGFLIAQSYRSNPDLKSFFKRRARRIYPALWVNLTVSTIAMLLAGMWFFRGGTHFLTWLVMTFAFGNNAIAEYATGASPAPGFYLGFPSGGVLWTIPVELSFYALVPVIFWRGLKDHALLASLALWSAVSFAVYFVSVGEGPYAILQYLWIFLIGGLLAMTWERVSFLFEGKAPYWLVAYAAVTIAGPFYEYAIPQPYAVLQTLVLGGAVIAIAFSFARLSGFQRGYDVSYGVYLWHMPVIWTMVGFGYAGRWRWMIAAMLITAAISFASWVLVERRFLRRRREREAVDAVADHSKDRPSDQHRVGPAAGHLEGKCHGRVA